MRSCHTGHAIRHGCIYLHLGHARCAIYAPVPSHIPKISQPSPYTYPISSTLSIHPTHIYQAPSPFMPPVQSLRLSSQPPCTPSWPNPYTYPIYPALCPYTRTIPWSIRPAQSPRPVPILFPYTQSRDAQLAKSPHPAQFMNPTSHSHTNFRLAMHLTLHSILALEICLLMISLHCTCCYVMSLYSRGCS